MIAYTIILQEIEDVKYILSKITRYKSPKLRKLILNRLENHSFGDFLIYKLVFASLYNLPLDFLIQIVEEHGEEPDLPIYNKGNYILKGEYELEKVTKKYLRENKVKQAVILDKEIKMIQFIDTQLSKQVINLKYIENRIKRIKLQFTNLFLSDYPKKRILSLILNTNLVDFDFETHLLTGKIYSQITNFNEIYKKEMPKKPKSMLDLYEAYTNINTKLSQPVKELKKIPLNSNSLNFEGRDYDIIVPKTNHDLINISFDFKNCLGDPLFVGRNLKDLSFIIALYEKNKPKYCIEIAYFSLNVLAIFGPLNAPVDDTLADLFELILPDLFQD